MKESGLVLRNFF